MSEPSLRDRLASQKLAKAKEQIDQGDHDTALSRLQPLAASGPLGTRLRARSLIATVPTEAALRYLRTQEQHEDFVIRWATARGLLESGHEASIEIASRSLSSFERFCFACGRDLPEPVISPALLDLYGTASAALDHEGVLPGKLCMSCLFLSCHTCAPETTCNRCHETLQPASVRLVRELIDALGQTALGAAEPVFKGRRQHFSDSSQPRSGET